MEGHGSDVPASAWNKTYNRRRLILYAPEDTRLNYTPGNKQELISAFLDDRRSRQLDPPITFWYSLLRKFLGEADARVFQSPPPSISHPNEVILLDDRKDPSGDVTSTRVWDSSGNPGYLRYPPKGEVRCSKAFTITELAAALMESVSGRAFLPYFLLTQKQRASGKANRRTL